MQSIIEPNPWLVTQRRPNARLRLYCFSYAGGSANVYLPWKNLLDGSIELCAVQLPGRGARLNEMPVPSLQKLVADIAAVISNETRLPFAFFGHSLGGLLAFELTRYCKHHLLPSPGHLIVSGCSAPQMRDATQRMHLLPDEEFIEELRKYNGTPPEILAHRELMQLVLPALRADFAADMPLRDDVAARYGEVIATLCHAEGLPAVTADGVGALVEEGVAAAGRRNRVSRATSGCVGLNGAPGNGPKPVMRMRSDRLFKNEKSIRRSRAGQQGNGRGDSVSSLSPCGRGC